jgi:hypothetical protein
VIYEIAKIRGVELLAAADRGLAMLALRPLSVALGRQGTYTTAMNDLRGRLWR